MLTEIRGRPLAVISDLHIGNPFSKAKRPVVDFFDWAARHGYDVVINGDGFEIAQASFKKIAHEVPEVFRAMRAFAQSGRKIYYVIGNHDMALESFVTDWISSDGSEFKMVPFLNVRSGSKRVRIEHGHLYDPFFMRHPHLYKLLTWLGGFALRLHPNFYRAWIALERFKSRFFWRASAGGIRGEHAAFREAARDLAMRGFDHVLFGHTHRPGSCEIGKGKFYFNSGSWLESTPFIEICDGEVRLREWSINLAPHVSLLAPSGIRGQTPALPYAAGM